MNGWKNVAKALDGRKPDYLIVQHMEPDHSANIENFVKSISGSNRCCKYKNFCHDEKTFSPKMDLAGKKLEVKDGESLTLGKHVLTFRVRPDGTLAGGYGYIRQHRQGSLFAADGFGKFGALDREEPWMTKHAVISSASSENTVCRYRSS